MGPTAKNKRPAARNYSPIKVCCPAEKRRQIEAAANTAGLSLSKYLLYSGLGYPIPSAADRKAVEELAKVNGDLGRLGGLLKLWLTDDARTALIGASTIRAVLAKIEANQRLVMELMKELLGANAKTQL